MSLPGQGALALGHGPLAPGGGGAVRQMVQTTRTMTTYAGGAGGAGPPGGLAQFATLRELAGKLGADQGKSQEEARQASEKLKAAEEKQKRTALELNEIKRQARRRGAARRCDAGRSSLFAPRSRPSALRGSRAPAPAPARHAAAGGGHLGQRADGAERPALREGEGV